MIWHRFLDRIRELQIHERGEWEIRRLEQGRNGDGVMSDEAGQPKNK